MQQLDIHVPWTKFRTTLLEYTHRLQLQYRPHFQIYIYIYTEIYGTPKLPRSRGSTRRHFLRPQGWSRFRSTKEGNRLARRLCYLPGPYYRILREHHLASLKLGSLLCCNFKILHIPSWYIEFLKGGPCSMLVIQVVLVVISFGVYPWSDVFFEAWALPTERGFLYSGTAT